jgi:hypothetical protein
MKKLARNVLRARVLGCVNAGKISRGEKTKQSCPEKGHALFPAARSDNPPNSESHSERETSVNASAGTGASNLLDGTHSIFMNRPRPADGEGTIPP